MALVDDIIDVDDNFASDRILDLLARDAAIDARRERSRFLIAIDNSRNRNSVDGAAILMGDDDVLRHIDKFASHVAGVSSLERGIRQTFAGTVSGDEVFQHRKSLAEVRDNRPFNNFTGRLGHQPAHAAELLDLALVTTGTGIHHHEQRTGLGLAIVVLDLAIERIGNGVGGVGPHIDDLLIALAIGDDAVAILLGDLVNVFVGFDDDVLFLLGDHHIDNPDGSAGAGGFLETEGFEFIEGFDGLFLPGNLIAAPDDVADLFLADVVIHKTQT